MTTLPTRIMVATDFSALGQLAVEHAFSLAARLGCTVDIVHIFTLQGHPESASQTRDELDAAELAARVKLNEVANDQLSTGRLGKVSLRFGDPASTILVMAAEQGAEMIVLGTHGRRGLGRLIMGSTAESVLRQAAVPVLVVKQKPARSRAESTRPAPPT